MTTAYFARGSQAARTEQDRIRAEYLELAPHVHPNAAEWGAIELHVAALQLRCTHPNMGNGTLPGHWKPVAPDQCPDCGCAVDVVDRVK